MTWSLLGVKKSLGTPRSVSFRGLIQNFRQASAPFICASSPLLPEGACKSWPRTLCCALRQHSTLSQCLYSPRCIMGSDKFNAGGSPTID